MVPVPPAELYAFDGQSLARYPATPADAYPAKVMAGRSRSIGLVVARSGTSWSLRTVDAPRRVDSLLTRVTGPAWLVDLGATFELQAGQLAGAILTAAETYWNARLAAGWSGVIACTTPDATAFDPSMDAERAAWNDLVRGSSVPAAVADLAAAAELADATNATYFDAGLHLTAAGATVAAGIITAAL